MQGLSAQQGITHACKSKGIHEQATGAQRSHACTLKQHSLVGSAIGSRLLAAVVRDTTAVVSVGLGAWSAVGGGVGVPALHTITPFVALLVHSTQEVTELVHVMVTPTTVAVIGAEDWRRHPSTAVCVA